MKPRLIACIILLCGVCGTAFGQTGYSLNENLENSATWAVTIHSTDGGYNGGVDAGPYDDAWNTNPMPQGYSKDMTVFCADIRHYDVSPSKVTIMPFSADTTGTFTDNGSFNSNYLNFTYYYANLERAAWLYDHYLPAVQKASGTQKQIDGAALQIAIWKAIETDTNDVSSVDDTSDVFYMSSYPADQTDPSIVDQANTWYTASANQKAAGTLFLAAHNGNYNQNMLGPAVAPELPGSLLFLVGLMIPALVFTRRRIHGMC